MRDKILKFFFIFAITVIPTLIIWIPFFLKLNSLWGIPLPTGGMATVVANYDGPLYIVVSKTLYDPSQIGGFPFSLPAIYYAAHFPLYPLLIKLFAFVFGFPYSMLFVTIISSLIAVYFFNKLAKEFVSPENALWLTFVFAIFPARWLIVRSVGSAEPLFIGSIIASLFYFRKEKYLLSAIWGLAAVLTKSPGILLFISYALSLLLFNFKKAATTSFDKWFSLSKIAIYLPLIIMPVALVILFYIYGLRYRDFFAYFHSGDNIHLFFPPFQIFNYTQPWVGTFWLEEIIFIYLFGFLGLMRLIKLKENILAWFTGVFFISILFVSHRDLIRYALPIIPFILLAYHKYIIKKEFKLALLFIIIPVYLYSVAFISQNVMPIVDWQPFL